MSRVDEGIRSGRSGRSCLKVAADTRDVAGASTRGVESTLARIRQSFGNAGLFPTRWFIPCPRALDHHRSSTRGEIVCESPPQSGYLTLTGTIAGYVFYAGIGYILAGWFGAGCGTVLLTILLARQLWHASSGIGIAGPAADEAAETGPPADLTSQRRSGLRSHPGQNR